MCVRSRGLSQGARKKKEVGRVSSNCPKSRSESDRWTFRALDKTVKELEPLATQGTVEGFFNNAENADKLGGLVEDIRDAIMEYQVRSQPKRTGFIKI